MKKIYKFGKMNLQRHSSGGPDEGNPAGDDTNPDGTKTLTQEEVNKLIQQNKAKAKEEAAKEAEKEYNEKLQIEIEKALEKSKLSDKEKETWEEKEARIKLEQRATELEKTNQELLEKITNQELRAKAAASLKEKGIDDTEKNLKLVLRANAEDTIEAIDLLAETLTEQKKTSAQTKPPKTSGGTAGEEELTGMQVLDKAKITGF